MKRSNSSSPLAQIVRAFFITSVILLGSFRNFAQQPSSHVNFENGYISYESVQGDEVVLDLHMENILQRKISILIVDAAGEKIFSRTFRDRNIRKKFRISAGTGLLTLIISDPVAKKEQQFKIATNQRHVGEFSVKRVM